MIPLKIHIKNFLSYGSPTQTISFEPYHLICLSGKNGHGKSSLLDALTWALWGQARKVSTTAKADEGLLRLGQTQMIVILDFMCNHQTYRVRREFSLQGSKMVTQLDFGIIDQQTQHLRSLTDKTIRATQALIEKTVGLSYEAFINSVFLRQGQSNEFSKKSPKERKEILADLLGLTRFEIIRKYGLEKMRGLSTHITFLEHLISRLQTECAELPLHSAQRIQLDSELAHCNEHEQHIHEQLKQAELRVAQLREKDHAYALLHKDYTHYYEHYCTLQKNMFDTFRCWRATQRQLTATASRSLTAHTEWEEEVRTLTNRAAERITLKERFIALCAREQELAQQFDTQKAEEARTYQDILHKQKINIDQLTIHNKESQTLRITLQQQLTLLNERLAATAYHRYTSIQYEELFDKRKQYYHHFVTRTNWLTEELKHIHHKKELLVTQNIAQCFTCEQDLSPHHRDKLIEDLQQKQRIFQHQRQRLIHTVPKLKQILMEQHACKEMFIQQDKLRLQISEIDEKITTYEQQLQKEYASNKESSANYELFKKQIHNDRLTCTQPIRGEKETVQSQLMQLEASIDQDTKRLEYLKQHRGQLAQATEHIKQITLQEQRKQEIHTTCATLKRLKKRIEELRLQIAPYDSLELQKTELQKHMLHLLTQRESIVQLKQKIMHQKGALEHHIAVLQEKEKEKEQHMAALATIKQTIDDYQAITHALSKDGIQALLIEQVIPEIEYEANLLLAKLTDNQAHLTIESVRDLKNGGIKETLDIKISDAMGIRPYELFSGGEAFRIDFALRLALSKLLARRAGTSLQTIIIDEGFGSQDEEGLTHIMEALYKIQDDFAKIIIVSHLSSLKDQFPVHFVVSKGPHGSSVRVIEQG